MSCATALFAATDDEIWGALRFPPTLHGARHAAMGSAGIAMVGDATATLTNPARLPAVLDPEVLLEVRSQDPDETALESGLLQFDPSINPFAGSSFSTEAAPDDDPEGMLAFVWPFDLARPLVLGGSIDATSSALTAGSSVTTIPLNTAVTPNSGDEVLRLSTGTLDSKSTNLTLGAGYGITPDFWIGAAAQVAQLEIDAISTGLLADPLQFTGPGMFDPRYQTSAPQPLRTTVTDGSDTGIGFSVGVFFRPHPTLGLATLYRGGPRFELPGTATDLLTGTEVSFTNTIKVPDRASIGAAWTPFLSHGSSAARTLVFALDVEHVTYSDLVEDFVPGRNILTSSDFVQSATFDADDATEVHFGTEWRLIHPSWSLALRAGAYLDENASIHLTDISGDVGDLQGQSGALIEGGFFEETDSEVHVTGGLGFSGQSFDLDFAVDVADPSTHIILSTRYRFR